MALQMEVELKVGGTADHWEIAKFSYERNNGNKLLVRLALWKDKARCEAGKKPYAEESRVVELYSDFIIPASADPTSIFNFIYYYITQQVAEFSTAVIY
jgi:hypothetical protein